jgi:hypothetical protein
MADPVKILTGFPTPPVTPPMPIIPSVASFFDAYLKKDELPSTATITTINSRIDALENVEETDTSSLASQIANVENIVNTKVDQLEKDTCDNAEKLETLRKAVLWAPSRVETSAWFDGDDDSKITINQGKLSSWADSSIPENVLIQDDVTKKPSYTYGCVSDNEVKFSGSSLISEVQKEAVTDSSGDYLIVFLFKPEGESNAEVFKGEMAPNDYLFNLSLENGILKGQTRDSDKVSSEISAEYNVISMLQSSDSLSLYINGSATSSSSVQNQPADALTKLYLGEGYFDIKEIVFLNRATCTGDRQTLEGYIAHKWGYDSKLFDQHPFKMGAPVIYKNQITCGYGFGS